MAPTRIIFGFIGSGGFIFLLDYINYSVKTINDLKTLGLPVLAVIPNMPDPEAMEKQRKKDVLLFSIAGVYLLCILGVLIMELMGLTYVDKIINGLFLIKSM